MRPGIATFHHAEFASLATLLAAKRAQNLTISLCIPTLNEEETIGEVVRRLKSALHDDCPLVDEVAVMDSGSSDRTCAVAAEAGADVYIAADILPHYGSARGKGENVWKASWQLRGDILCFIDGDVRNMHPRFVYGPLGILLLKPLFSYAKGFYDRPPAMAAAGLSPAGGGRVTEALVRPLFSLFFPELASLAQPLAGECAVRRSVLETLSMPTGYGLETAQVIDIYLQNGLSGMAQCDLDERLHRHQDTTALGKMGFSILHAFLKRARQAGLIEMGHELPVVYRHLLRRNGVMELQETACDDFERPPLIEVPEYRAKFS